MKRTVMHYGMKTVVGRTPWTRTSRRYLIHQQADVGVGRGPGGPPHCTMDSTKAREK
jgi:hypothetical protein